MKLYGQTLTARYKSLIVKVVVAAIKVNPSVNKVNIIIANKNKLSFLWRLFWDEKHVEECANQKTKYFYVYIFNISDFDRRDEVTLIDFLKLRKLLFFQN